MNEHVRIFTGTSIQVNRIASLLEEQNISFLIKNPIESGRLAGFGTSGESVELFVLNSDLKNAEKVLRAFEI
ncbi:hypothetical protein CW736_09925 [Nonlabens sp. MB-3u-79]|jgi:hypothetical protein|uniref:putative signal transducing protein n=1 Tax=Nonlabens sp. MB-3u-79 TaxID=2058134 RepID=UPI000C3018C5|nr:DUF2007 domain-containing protein [Nonlabens sp. MB-3u-79]AUC79662.1 hypothetical protein CW736_09925 [Nonlabens sp. MB-3u-79]|tara:strand:- start:106 stop:321 length:216 start_codon:yes stop_codon:yes gene_type:complete